MAIIKCKYCSHEWISRTKTPKFCPKCRLLLGDNTPIVLSEATVQKIKETAKVEEQIIKDENIFRGFSK